MSFPSYSQRHILHGDVCAAAQKNKTKQEISDSEMKKVPLIIINKVISSRIGHPERITYRSEVRKKRFSESAGLTLMISGQPDRSTDFLMCFYPTQ